MQFSEFENSKEESKVPTEDKSSKHEEPLNLSEPLEIEDPALLRDAKPGLKKLFFAFFIVNWYFFFALFGISLLLGSLLANLEVKDFSRAFSVMKTIEDVTQADPIYSIAMVDAKVKNCPEGFDLLSLGDWMGTMAGCYDPHSNLLFPSEECNVDYYYPVVATAPAKYYTWKSRKFCVARLSNTSRIPLDDCKPEHLRCQGFCVSKTMNCPFNNVTVAVEDGTQTISIHNAYTERIRVSNDRLLDLHWYKPEENRNSSQQLVGFRIGTRGFWCLDDSRAPEVVRYFGSEKTVGYPLANRREKGCGWYGGIGGFLDVDNLKSFYEDNQLELEIKDLPLYDKFISNETAQLIPIYKGSSSFEMDSSAECQAVSSINNNEMQEMQETLKTLPNRLLFGQWISYIVSTISVLVVLTGVLYWKRSVHIRKAELMLARLISKVIAVVFVMFVVLDTFVLFEWIRLMKVEGWIEDFIRCSLRYKDQQGRPLDEFWGKVKLSIVLVNITVAMVVVYYVYLKKKIKRESAETNRYFATYSD